MNHLSFSVFFALSFFFIILFFVYYNNGVENISITSKNNSTSLNIPNNINNSNISNSKINNSNSYRNRNIFNSGNENKLVTVTKTITLSKLASRYNYNNVRKNAYSFINLKKKKLPHLLCFHSKECEFCNVMETLLDRLKEEENVDFLKLDVNENPYNFELLQQLDIHNLCGSIPYYYNLKTHYTICGATTYSNIRNWALDKRCNPNEPPLNDDM